MKRNHRRSFFISFHILTSKPPIQEICVVFPGYSDASRKGDDKTRIVIVSYLALPAGILCSSLKGEKKKRSRGGEITSRAKDKRLVYNGEQSISWRNYNCDVLLFTGIKIKLYDSSICTYFILDQFQNLLIPNQFYIWQ